MHAKKPNLLKSILGLLVAAGLGFLVFQRSGKPRTAFQHVSGRITSITNTHPAFPNLDTAKYRYLEIDGYGKTFEIFIGKASGDFKPQFEHFDSLKTGDSLTVYFDENYKTKSDPINRLAYFIDRGNEVIFIKGDWEKYLAYVIWGICAATLAVLVWRNLRQP